MFSSQPEAMAFAANAVAGGVETVNRDTSNCDSVGIRIRQVRDEVLVF